jgi:hypothetical protein
MPTLPSKIAERPKARSRRGVLVTFALVAVACWIAGSWSRRGDDGGTEALEPAQTRVAATDRATLDRAEAVVERQGAGVQPSAEVTASPAPPESAATQPKSLDAEVVLLLPSGDPFPGLELRAQRASDRWQWEGRTDAAGRCVIPGARTADRAPVELRVTGENAWPCVWTGPLEPIVVRQVPRKGEIDVVVTDTSGSPIGNALVRMIPRSSSLRESRPAAVESDANGCVRLPAVVDADITLQATAPGFLGLCRQLDQPYDGVSTAVYRLELTRAALHRVVVVDSDGVPAAGLAVRCPSGTIPEITTDQDGVVVVPAHSGERQLFVEPPGDPYRVPLRVTLLRTSSRAATRIVLPEPVRLRFAFVGEGVPIAERLVIRVKEGATVERLKGCVDPAEGELTLLMDAWITSSPLLPGLVELDAPVPWSGVDAVELGRSGQSVRIAASSFEMRDGVPTTALPASAGVVGRVEPRSAVSGDWALFVEGPMGYFQRCDLCIGEDGTFRSARLPAGPLTLSYIPTRHLATSPGLLAGVAVFRGELGEGEVLDVGELETPGLGDLVTIRVVEPGGAPAYGALVIVEANNSQRWRGSVGDDGIALAGLSPGIAYKVRAMRGAAWSSNPVTWQSSVAGGEIELLVVHR